MLKIIQGSFLDGCGVIVLDTKTDSIYHLLVHKEGETGRLFVEIGGKKYYESEVKGNV